MNLKQEQIKIKKNYQNLFINKLNYLPSGFLNKFIRIKSLVTLSEIETLNCSSAIRRPALADKSSGIVTLFIAANKSPIVVSDGLDFTGAISTIINFSTYSG